MGWFSKLIGTDKALTSVDNIVDKGSSILDKAFYTKEEKADFKAKMAGVWLKIQEVIANENTARAITRRILAVMFCGTFLSMLAAGCVIWKFDKEWAEFIFQSAGVLATSVALIIGFYFGYYAVENIVKKFKGKKE